MPTLGREPENAIFPDASWCDALWWGFVSLDFFSYRNNVSKPSNNINININTNINIIEHPPNQGGEGNVKCQNVVTGIDSRWNKAVL